MTILDQLEQNVSLPLLAQQHSIAHLSLLEQFYALLIARLAQPQVYSRLLQASHQSTRLEDNPSTAMESSSAATADSSVFSQLWHDPQLRQFIIDELSATHHLDNSATLQLITGASELAYHELKDLANGQFLPAFLQQQSQIRHYLPVWAQSVLSDQTANKVDATSAIDIARVNEAATIESSASAADKDDANSYHTSYSGSSNKATTDAITTPPIAMAEASHDNSAAPPIARQAGAHSNSQLGHIRKRNNKNDGLWRWLLLITAIAALALLWLLVIQPNYLTKAQPMEVKPTIVVTEPEPVAAALTPVELLIAVDNSGRLYTCSATVGSQALQQQLKQALVMSFGEQADSCELTLKSGVADSFATIDIGLLPSVLSLLRSAPFARLQLQNEIITIESPDDSLSQRLLTDMRALAPTANIMTNAALGAAESPTMPSEQEDLSANDFEQSNGQQQNNSFDEPSFTNDNFNDSYANNNASNNANNYVNNNTNNSPNSSSYNGSSNTNANTRPIKGMSTAEVDDLANSVIVAEQLRNEARVENNAAAE